MEWSELIKVVALISVPFTVYLGFKKLGNKALISYSISSNRHTATRLSEIVITNCKDKPLVIHALYVVEGKEIMLPIREFSPPLVVKGLESCLVENSDVSGYYVKDDPFEIQFDTIRDIHVLTSGGSFRCKADPTPHLYTIAKKMDYRLVTVQRRVFNGHVFSSRVRYAVMFRFNQSELRTAFIDQGGLIGLDWPFKENMLSADTMKSAEIVKETLTVVLDGRGVSVLDVEELNPPPKEQPAD